MLKVQKYRVTPNAFPAYNLARKRVPPLHQRYVELTGELGINGRLEIPEFGSIDLSIVENLNMQKSLDISDVVPKRSSIEQTEEANVENIAAYLEGQVVNESGSIELVLFSEYCVSRKEISLLSKTYKDRVFVIIEEAESNPESNGLAACYNVLKTTKENINDNVGDILERLVLKTITTECENVKLLLDKKKLLDHLQSENSTDYADGVTKYIINGCKKRRNATLMVSNTSERSNGFQNISCETEDGTKFDLHLDDNCQGCDATRTHNARKLDLTNMSDDVCEKLLYVDRTIIESLLAEMTVLFRTSCVPEDEWPNFKVYKERKVDEQLQTDLFNISPAVKGMGYRFDRFVICIEEAKDMDDYDSILKSIGSVMDGSGVEDYTVEEISKELKPYSCDVRVGAKIETGGPDDLVCGTLGCFAFMTDDSCEKTCALISKHVATCGNRFFCPDYGITMLNNPLGHVVTATVQDTGLDIAALLLDERVRICAKYKSEDPDFDSGLLQCKLHDYTEDSNDEILSSGQQVYIWGATSKPGKGVITIPTYKIDGMENGLILIEDRSVRKGEIPERFCKPGDSGAVVCAEDRRGEFVHAVAMLMGILNEHALKKDPTTRGKYLSVPLSTGLQELTKRTGYSFELCECISR
ncbi:uncharacterized protein LOC123541121 [Mercenaria mercenaria]|uniref:uncharacterized protein LOC123541121 n=1 Tax=Mercenaria mercenaria TaxID=6596 RepID=UPI00234E8A58|nr:uncharacterized protein LOC123541121 [Mercenaria mercenaria]